MNTPRTKIPDHLIREQKDARDENIDEKPWDNEARWLYNIRIFFLLFGATVSSAVVAVFLWHLLVPLRWLSPAELDKISNFALSIIVGLLISGMTTYFFSKKR